MNKVYFVSLKEEYCNDHYPKNSGVFIAAMDSYIAKILAANSEYFMEYKFAEQIDPKFKVKLKLNHYYKGGFQEKGVPYHTWKLGELTLQELNDLGIALWNCLECGWDDFEIEDDNYTCRACGYYGEVPNRN